MVKDGKNITLFQKPKEGSRKAAVLEPRVIIGLINAAMATGVKSARQATKAGSNATRSGEFMKKKK
jgi:hypothetical protein